MTPSFESFFVSGFDSSESPFLRPKARLWAKHLSMRMALFSAALFLLELAISPFFPKVSALLLLVVYILSGTLALIESLDQLSRGEINIDLLMTLAALLSVFIGSAREGALLLVLFALAEAMESLVSQKTRSTLHSLSELQPPVVNLLLEDGTTLQKPTRQIIVGQKILVKTGELVPLDGKVVEGAAFITAAHLTGESTPVSKKVNDAALAGSLLADGYLILEVEKPLASSTVSRIIELVREAEEQKPATVRLLDRIGRPYATTIICLSFLFALILPTFFHVPWIGAEGAIYRSLAFLVAASPCALIIAIPTAYFAAISACARRGILLKGGVTLESLARCKQICFDKTGTLTTGALTLQKMTHLSGKGELPALQMAATLERGVHHPIAEAIAQKALLDKLPILPTEELTVIPGSGVEAILEVGGRKIKAMIGHLDFIISKDQKNGPLLKKAKEESFGMIAALFAGDELYLFEFEDTVRKEAQKVLLDLEQECKMTTALLTGDHQKSAKRVADELGIHRFFSDLRPEDKMRLIDELSKESPLVMVGDGINDAPALTRALIGISMGGEVGSKTAMEASDMVLLREDLALLPWLYRKARSTRAIIIQNLTLALSVILLATTPTLLGLIPLWLAVILHEGGTLLVGLNSLRLLRK